MSQLNTRLRALRWLGILGTISILGAACGTTTTPGTQLAADQTLRFPSDSDIGTLDPAQINAETDVELYQNLFDGLLKFDDGLNVVPDIATALPTVTDGGMTYTFKLNPNAKFSNGHLVKASDFIYSFSRAAAEGQNAYGTDFDHVVGYDVVSKTKGWATNQKMLSGMSATDDHTLVIKLISPWGVFNTELALAAAAQVVDPTVVNQDDVNWWSKPATAIGTGPYKMTAYTAKQLAEFTAVDNWWGSPQPTVKKVHIDFIGDMATGVAKYEQGGYDLVGYGGMASDIPVEDILRIQADPAKKSQLHFIDKVRTIWIEFNFQDPNSPFRGLTGAGRDLRMALSLALDRTVMADVACAHAITCSPATGGLIHKGLLGYLGDGKDPLATFDPVKAKQLLLSADPTGSKTKGLVYVFDPNKAIYKATAENIQAQWQQNLNLHVDIQPVDHATFIKKSTAHQYILFRAGWNADYNHPQDWFDNLFVTGAGSNTGAYSDPQVDALANKADAAASISAGIPDYNSASQQMITDVAYAPLVYFKGELLFKPYLQGNGSNPFNDFYWSEMKILQH